MTAGPRPALPVPAGCDCSGLHRLPGDDTGVALDRLRPYVRPNQAAEFGIDPALCTGRPGAPRHWPDEFLVCDPADDATIPLAAFAAAARRPNIAVCHPAPGISGDAGLLLSLLIALGKARDCLQRDPQPAEPADLVRLWLRAHRTRDLIVLRYDHLPAPLRGTLRRWISQAPARLWMVTARSAPPPGDDGIHPVSAATFADYFGCPHHEQAPAGAPPPAPGAHGAALRAVGLFTVCDDVQRLLPNRADRLLGQLNDDLADARAALARLMFTDSYFTGQPGPAAVLHGRPRVARPLGQDILGDQAAVAAAVSAYLATAGPGDTGQMIRLRAIQLAFLERGWLLADVPPALTLPGPPCSLGADQAARIGLLASPVKAGLLTLAYATGLPPSTLASVRASDIAPPGHEIRVDGHSWAIPRPAAPFLRALRLAAYAGLGPRALRDTLTAAARLAGLPPPPLPADDCGATHPWLAGRNLRLTRLPDAGRTAPDVVELACRAMPGPVPGERLPSSQ